MAEETNSDDEERMKPFDLNLPAVSEDMTGALKSDEILEAKVPNVDQNSNGWSDLLNKIRYQGQLESESEIEAASAKLKEWMTEKTEKTEEYVLEKLKSVKVDEESANVFKLLNSAMNDPDKFLEWSARNSESITEFFEKPLVKIFFKTHSYKTCNVAFNRFGDLVLKTQLLAMLDSGAARETTGHVLMNLWRSRKYSADTVFEFLELNRAGRNILGSSRWNVWISYAFQSNMGNEIYASKLVSVMLKNNFYGKNLDIWIKSIQKSFPWFVMALKRAVEMEDAELTPNKRRHFDDGM